LIPAVIVVLSMTIGGGLLARELYRPQVAERDVMAALPASSSLPPAQEPGPATVELTADAAVHPQNETVRTLLQAYFDAINKRDYMLWASSVSAERRQSRTRNQWLNDYNSTKDGSILVHRIETPAPGQLRVLVGFTSTQDLSDAPVGLQVGCIHWRLTLPVVLEDARWRIDAVFSGTTPEREKC
jgi:hypothetical protein